MKDFAYYNGRICPAEEMMVPAEDRAFYFGDGIYDVTTVHHGKCFAMKDHLDRFFGNAAKLKINLGMTRQELEKICLDFVALQDPDVETAVLYLQASRGTAPRAHAFPKDAKANLYMNLKAKKLEPIGQHVRAITLEDKRFEMCDVKTLNLLLNCMYQQEAKEQGCYEAILHRGDRVTEGAHTNISILKDGIFRTPPLDELILPSVTRKHYLELCTMLGIRVMEKPFTLEELMNADEVFILSSTGVCNVADEIDGVPVGGKDPVNVKRLADAYAAKIAAETE